MGVLKNITIGGGILFYILFLFFFFRNSVVLDSKIFYIVILSLTFIVCLTLLIFWLLSKYNVHDIEIKGNDFVNIYEQFNNILQTMPTAEQFAWDMGDSTRIDSRIFEKREYIGIVGNGRETNKRMLTIGELINGKIYIKRFIGDPTPYMEQDIFNGFVPVHKDTYSVWRDVLKKHKKKQNPFKPSSQEQSYNMEDEDQNQ